MDKKLSVRTMPHNVEAEQSLIGCMLIDENVPMNVIGIIKSDDFYTETNRLIFEAMVNLYVKNIPIDFVTVSDELALLNNLDAVGGYDYLTELTNIVPSAVNFKTYLNIVKRDSQYRRLIDIGNKIIDLSYNSQDQDVLDVAQRMIFDISQNDEKKALVKIGETVDDVIHKFEEIQKDKTCLRGITTGFYALDELTNGLQRSDLILLAARPACGKTSFGMNVVTNAALAGYKCAIFSLEMPKSQITQRTLCSIGCVNMKNALSGEMDVDEWKRSLSAAEKLKELDIFIDDNSSISPAEILNKCRKLKREKGLDVVMIDYLQLMSNDGKSESRQLEISSYTRSLKIAAKELDVPIILISQLNRAVDTRPNHLPVLSDLRESGSIEQDADIVMFVHRPDIFTDYQGEPNTAQIIVAKHRNGETGVINLKWRGEFTSFVNLTKDADAMSLQNSAPTYEKKHTQNVDVNSSGIGSAVDINVDDIF